MRMCGCVGMCCGGRPPQLATRVCVCAYVRVYMVGRRPMVCVCVCWSVCVGLDIASPTTGQYDNDVG